MILDSQNRIGIIFVCHPFSCLTASLLELKEVVMAIRLNSPRVVVMTKLILFCHNLDDNHESASHSNNWWYVFGRSNAWFVVPSLRKAMGHGTSLIALLPYIQMRCTTQNERNACNTFQCIIVIWFVTLDMQEKLESTASRSFTFSLMVAEQPRNEHRCCQRGNCCLQKRTNI